MAIAHGYAKVAERAMAVALHSNVGLMHASMALFNAFCDRVPMLVLGATGPLDAAEPAAVDRLAAHGDRSGGARAPVPQVGRPAGVGRGGCASRLPAPRCSRRRGPCAPVYVCLDASVQEERLTEPVRAAAARRRFRPAPPPHAAPELVEEIAERPAPARRSRSILAGARIPVGVGVVAGASSSPSGIGARVFTHLKLPAAFPTDHPLHAAPPRPSRRRSSADALNEADVIVALDWLDLGGALERRRRRDRRNDRVRLARPAAARRLGEGALRPVAADGTSAGAPTRRASCASCSPSCRPPRASRLRASARASPHRRARRAHARRHRRTRSRAAAGGQDVTLIRVPTSLARRALGLPSPLDYLGADGGEGLGSGPGHAIGAALALTGARTARRWRSSGDGDFLMGANALWTAAHYGIPLLIVVANNRSFFNDEVHQQHVAERRERPAENRWIGQRIDDPPVDLASLARKPGLVGYGPVSTRASCAGGHGSRRRRGESRRAGRGRRRIESTSGRAPQDPAPKR